MGTKINSLGLTVKGQLRRKYDPDTDTTTLDLDATQCTQVYRALDAVAHLLVVTDPDQAYPQLPLPSE